MSKAFDKLREPFTKISFTKNSKGDVQLVLFNAETCDTITVDIKHDSNDSIVSLLLDNLFPSHSGFNGRSSVRHFLGPIHSETGKHTHCLFVDCELDDETYFMSEYGEILTWKNIKRLYANAFITRI